MRSKFRTALTLPAILVLSALTPSANALTARATAGTPVLLTPGDGAVTLQWDVVPGATSYRVTRDGAPIATVGGTVTTWTDMIGNGTAGNYAVEAIGADTAGEVGTMAGTAVDLAPPGPVSTAYSMMALDGGLVVRWSASADVAGGTAEYQFYVNGELAGVRAGGSVSDWFSIGGLADGVVAWAVKTKDLLGNVSVVSGRDSIVDVDAAPVPIRLRVSWCRGSTAELSWGVADVAGGDAAVSFNVYKNGDIAGNTRETTYPLAGLLPGVPARFTITSVDTLGNESPPTYAVTVTPTAPEVGATSARSSDTAPDVAGTCVVSTPEELAVPAAPTLALATHRGSDARLVQGTVVYVAGADDRSYAGYRLYGDGSLLRSGSFRYGRSFTYVAIPLASGTTAIEAELIDLHGQVSPRQPLATTVLDQLAPAVPAALSAARNPDGSATVTWAAQEAQAYAVEVDGEAFATTTATRVTLPPTTLPTTRTVRVRAIDHHGQLSLPSPPLFVIT